jgi:predicted ATPase/DNA-binding CsgD family transcriptional regulator
MTGHKQSPHPITSPLEDDVLRYDLPMPPIPLVGREHELELASQRLMRADVRLLTITGTGGTGKTRLAIQLAADLQAHFTRGVAFVDLAPIRDAGLVLSLVAHRLGIREVGGQSIPQRVRRVLGHESMLLVLDNFEQVLDAATGIGELLELVTGLKLIVTSREPLRLRWENEFPLQPLTIPSSREAEHIESLANVPSVALFVQRAQAVQPSFALSATNARVVAELCRRLDGLPLAIELAAARLKVLPPPALLSRLNQRLDLLAAQTRDVPARHQTLRAAIRWSTDLFSPEEQAFFRSLAVFSGGCTLEAVENVATLSATSDLQLPEFGDSATSLLVPPRFDALPANMAVLDGLTSLIDKNLLYTVESPDGEPRFRMLETVASYALEMLRANGEESRTRDAHARYILTLLDEIEPHLWGPEQIRWIARLNVELDNVRAALRWCLDRRNFDAVGRMLRNLLFFWWMQGYMTEARRWAEEALAMDTPLPPLARARALFVVAYAAMEQGEYAQSVSCIEQALTLFRSEGDAWGTGHTLLALGFLSPTRDDVTGGITHFQEGQAILQEHGDRWGVGLSLTGLAAMAVLLDDFDAAEQFASEHISLAREMEDVRSIGQALDDLAVVALMRQDYDRAAGLYWESLPLCREAGNVELVGYCLRGLAVVAAARNAPSRAARLFGASDALWEVAGVVVWPPRKRTYDRGLENVRRQLGDPAFNAARLEGKRLSVAEAIRVAAASGDEAPPETDEQVVPVTTREPMSGEADLALLTRREREVAALIARGMISREIADVLVVSERTVDAHADHIRTKLGLRSRAEIAAWGVARGLSTRFAE